jgi:hypothetical protein
VKPVFLMENHENSVVRLLTGNRLLALFLLFLAVSHPITVRAHTEGPMQLAAAPAGPYKITVWTSPDPARVGEVHVAVAVTLTEDASPVLDAEVSVILNPLGDGSPISAPATTDNSKNKFLYEAIVLTEEGGTYETIISIVGSDGARGDASFELEIESESSINWFFVGSAIIILAALLYLVMKRRASKEVDEAEGST